MTFSLYGRPIHERRPTMWFPILSALWHSYSSQRPVGRKRPSNRLALEALEDRTVPALFTAASVSDLIADINAANALPGPDTIALTDGATYTLTAADNYTAGDGNGLPIITDPAGLTLIGKGANIE